MLLVSGDARGIAALGLSVLEPFLRLLGCTDTMMPYAIPYARFILLSAPVSCATFVLSNALRSEGYSTLSMVGVSTGGILNVILDPILIFGLDMGTGGAALATGISQAVSFLILLAISLVGNLDLYLPLLGVELPMDPTIAFFFFFIVYI